MLGSSSKNTVHTSEARSQICSGVVPPHRWRAGSTIASSRSSDVYVRASTICSRSTRSIWMSVSPMKYSGLVDGVSISSPK